MTDDSLKAVRHVQEMQVIDGKDYEGIKEAVFKYGGVESSLYSTIRSSQGSSVYYNQNTSAYCYIGTEKPNHDVVIIGWDDNYSRSNFNTPLEGDGAFICQNSWGDGFGENGIFYVSYYDTNIGTHNVAYTRVDDVHNYDHIYQSDLCGWVGKLGYDSDQIYGANVFEAKGKKHCLLLLFMRPVQTHSMKFMWCTILKMRSLLRRENSLHPERYRKRDITPLILIQRFL